MDYGLVPLHKRIDLNEKCCNLLNSEWKRSDGTRLRWLEQSNDDYPCNLAMLESKCGTLVGHVRLTCVVGDTNALYVSSVIVTKEQRGLGLGKKLMDLTAEYAAKRKCKTLHLRSDKQMFYAKCGYEVSTPVEQCTGKALQAKILAFQQNQNTVSTAATEIPKLSSPDLKMNDEKCVNIFSNLNGPQINIPPPPSLCDVKCSTKSKCATAEFDEPNCCSGTILWMKKVLLQA